MLKFHIAGFVIILACSLTARAEEPMTAFDYYEKAVEAFPKDKKEAVALAVRAHLCAMYDMDRVADQSAHQAWLVLRQNLGPIYQWGSSHPKIYQDILRDTIKWAKASPPPSYSPDWMINHGMGAIISSLSGKTADTINPQHKPEMDWNKEIGYLEELLNGLESGRAGQRQKAAGILKERALSEKMKDIMAAPKCADGRYLRVDPYGSVDIIHVDDPQKVIFGQFLM